MTTENKAGPAPRPAQAPTKAGFVPFETRGFVAWLRDEAHPYREVILSLREIRQKTGSDFRRIRRLRSSAVRLGLIRYSFRNRVPKYRILGPPKRARRHEIAVGEP